MEWKHYFRKHILEKGQDYFYEGAVEDLEITEDDITATVYGTEAYDVEITLSDGEIEDMYCSCPYAESGEYCKHMAAVLYEWEETEVDEEEAGDEPEAGEEQPEGRGLTSGEMGTGGGRGTPDKNKSVEELVEQADPAVVKDFLVELLRGDKKLLSKFRLLTAPRISREDMRRYQKMIDRTVREYSGPSGYISYRDAYGFIREMDRYLCDDAETMIKKGCLREAFELTGYVILKMSEAGVDDSDGGQGEIGLKCQEMWERILEQADADTEHAMFDWFLSHLNGTVIGYMKEYIEEFVMGHFSEEAYLNIKLEFSEKRARQEGESSDYAGEKWAMVHIRLMEETGAGEGNIRQYCREHWKYSAVRQYYVSMCMEKKDYEEAAGALKECLRIDESKPGLVRTFAKMLKTVYRDGGKKEEYKKQLWELVTKLAQGDVEEFRELKGLYTEEEWESVREKVFAAMSPYARIEILYREEGLYDRLLERVMSADGLYKLEEYEDDLKDIYPEEILQKYTDELSKMARRTADRKRYQEWVALLRKMRKIEGGEEQVERLVGRWKKEYANRPAMMEELGRL